jgi:hypothetical protein
MYHGGVEDFSVVDRSETSSRDPEGQSAMNNLWERRLRRVNDGKIRSGKNSERKNRDRMPPQHQLHFESPQFRHVIHPSIMTTAVMLHFPHNCAPGGNSFFANASCCLF